MENNTRTNWYNTGEPFNLEVEIIDDSMRKTIEDIVLRSVIKGTELLPGLRVNKAYKQSLDRQDVLAATMKDEFEQLMKNTQNAFNEFFNKWDKDKNPELKGAVKQEVNYSSDGSFNGWAPYTNCIRNCKKCFAKCLYRKEQNPDQQAKREIVSTENAKQVHKETNQKPKYDGGWVDMEDRNAVETMFNSVQI